MRHRVKGRKLNRTNSHYIATMRALATSLIKHKKIKTTTAKAKELRTFVEPLITKAKVDDFNSRRAVARHIHDKDALNELFSEIKEKVAERNGGYTRVIKIGNRPGDAAELSIIELVDFNDLGDKKEKTTTTKKSKKKADTVKATKAETPTEEIKDEDVQDAEVIEEKVEEPEEIKEEKTEEEPKAEEKKEDEAEGDKDKSK